MTTTKLTSNEREELLKQIRERRAKLLEQRPTLSWEVSPFDCMCDEACRPFMANAPKDIDFLLSLLDSYAMCRQVQKRGEHSSNTCACVVAVEPFIQSDAATRMRDKCVEKIRERLRDPSLRFADDGIKAAVTDWTNMLIRIVESLTLDQVEQETK